MVGSLFPGKFVGLKCCHFREKCSCFHNFQVEFWKEFPSYGVIKLVPFNNEQLVSIKY